MNRRPWTRDETLVAFNFYCKTPFGRLHARNPDIIALAAALKRTPSAVAMKCCNLASLDPVQQARGTTGLAKVSRVDREIWETYRADPENVGFECEVEAAKALHKKPEASDSVAWKDVEGLDRTAITKLRVNQAFFRRTVIAAYRNECCVCAIPIQPLLVAAHIVPWTADRTIRMNPHNGLCLCSLHDRAYDRGLLRIGRDYSIALSRDVKKLAKNLPVARALIDFEGRQIQLPDRWQPDGALLERHEELVRVAKL